MNPFKKYISFTTQLPIPPPKYAPLLYILGKPPPKFQMRWLEDDLLPPESKTEQELLRENIDKEWDW